jgi:Fe-S oxidoreductase
VRKLPRWRRPKRATPVGNADVLLFADTFNRYFEPENVAAARRVMEAMGLTVGEVGAGGDRPLCCGRTYLSAGMVEDAKHEMTRSIAAFRKALDAGTPIVGLEPSCVLTFRDEAPRLIDGWTEEMGARIQTFDEFIDASDFDLPLKPIAAKKALLHGHCHQKAADIMGPVQRILARIPGLTVEMIDSSCCGMAGAFGYQAETRDVSLAMAELSLAPAIRAAEPDTIVIASGTSCRHQISDTTTRNARHVAHVLAEALA